MHSVVPQNDEVQFLCLVLILRPQVAFQLPQRPQADQVTGQHVTLVSCRETDEAGLQQTEAEQVTARVLFRIPHEGAHGVQSVKLNGQHGELLSETVSVGAPGHVVVPPHEAPPQFLIRVLL